MPGDLTGDQSMDLPLFPLHTVLCPGVALPLHVFEERYQAMIGHCLAESSAFGVILIREGREVGFGDIAVAEVGTMAEIREATRHDDGRYDLLTIGTRRFRLDSVRMDPDAYLIGEVTPLAEEVGRAERAQRLADRVSRLFVRYLDLLSSEDDEPDATAAAADDEAGPAAGASADGSGSLEAEPGAGQLRAVEPGRIVEPGRAVEPGQVGQISEPGRTEADSPTGSALDPAASLSFLDEAAHSLVIPDDPTVLSYLLSGIVQVEPIRRQNLLEMPTAELRLAELASLLKLEITLLERRLRNYQPDPRLLALRRN